ncbi:MAG: DUF2946 family protein [Gammaproteobacteria bacterium]
MRRHLRPTVWLGILAMLAQLLLPSVHAASYAGRSGDPLAYAVCGLGSPALLAQLRASLPQEVLDDLRARHALPQLPDCELCGAAHGLAAAGHAATVALVVAATRAAQPPALAAARFTATRALRPPPRAPPAPA